MQSDQCELTIIHLFHSYVCVVINEGVSDGRASAASGDVSITAGSDGRAASAAESDGQLGGSRDGQWMA